MSVSLSEREILHVARLARLGVAEDEIAGYVDKLSGILALVDQLQRADTQDVAPMAHPLDQTQRLRADAVTEEDRRDFYQQNAPATERGLYLVPRVIE